MSLINSPASSSNRRGSLTNANGSVSLTQKEQSEYSLLKAISGLAREKGGVGGLEKEVSDAIASQVGRSTSGVFIPTNLATTTLNDAIASRALGASTPSDGGYLIGSQVLPMIELLRNKMVVARLGATFLNSLKGSI